MAVVTRRTLTSWMIGVVTFLAGLLFGHDQGVISGARPPLTEDRDLSTFESEVITSWVTLGALVAWGTADRIGRRWMAVSAGALFAAGAANWLAAFLVAQLLLSLVDAIGESTTFFLFSALCGATFVFVWILVPETKGRSLEEIRKRWMLGGERVLDGERPA